MKVSILMNGYNCSQYVSEAISSVLMQTYRDWEIVFIDNCSQDNTREIVHSFCTDKIKYIRLDETKPLGEARQLGLQHCDGEFLCFLDTDDLWDRTKLERQIEAFSKDDDLILNYTGVDFVDEKGLNIGFFIPKSNNEDVFRQQLVRYEINQQSVMIRNIIDIQFDADKRYSVDYNLFMKICLTYKTSCIKERLVKYRIHKNNMSHDLGELEWVEQKSTLDEIIRIRPDIEILYAKEYSLALARADYYRARYLFSIGDYQYAREILKEHKSKNFFFMMLYVLSKFPAPVWLYLHKRVRKFS